MLWKAGDDMKILAAQHVKLGFIGLGNMGNRIAQRLLAHGYKLFVFDRNRTMSEAPVPNGAVPVNDIVELARSADVILSCVTNESDDGVPQPGASTRKAVIGQAFYWSKASVLQVLSMTSRWAGFSSTNSNP